MTGDSPLQFALDADVGRALDDDNFVVVPGPIDRDGVARLSAAYDRAVAAADPADTSVRSSTRVSDIVNRGPEFDAFYVYGPVLGAGGSVRWRSTCWASIARE